MAASEASTMPRTIAIVPARSGSKGLPGKNIAPLGGHPLLAYAVAAGQQARHVTRVICSTDDPELAAHARAYGAETPFLRPAELAGDTSTDVETFQHALAWLAENEGDVPDLVANLRPTSPLRPAGQLDQALAQMAADPAASSIRSICPSPLTPYKMWQRDRDGRLHPLLDVPGLAEPYNMPRQALPEAWWQTGQIDIVRRDVLMAQNSMSGQTILGFATDLELAVDIDRQEDLDRAADILDRRYDCLSPEPV